MPTENSKTNNEAQIRELIENRIKAVRAKDHLTARFRKSASFFACWIVHN
jgi:hypothetical protein